MGYNLTNGTSVSAKNIGGIVYADQYPTIQDAINATDVDEDGIADLELYAPSGTYNVNYYKELPVGKRVGLVLMNNLKIKGNGINKTIIRQADGQNLSFFIQSKDNSFISNVELSDLTIDCNIDGQTGFPTATGLPYGVIAYFKNSTVHNVRITNCGLGLPIYGSNSEYSHIIVDNNKYSGVWFTSSSSKFNTLTQSIIANNDGDSHGIFVGEDKASNNTISFNYVYGNNKTGIVSAYIHNDIVGNKVFDNGQYGVFVDDGASLSNGYIGTQVSRNVVFSNNFTGINIGQGRGWTVSNNFIWNNSQAVSDTYYGIYVQGSDGIVSNNILYKFNTSTMQRVGIKEEFGNNNTFYGNDVRESGISALMSIGGVDSVVRNNYGTSPFNWGNKASAPSAFGAGDTYFNTTDNAEYKYNGSAWNKVSDNSELSGWSFVFNNGSNTLNTTVYGSHEVSIDCDIQSVRLTANQVGDLNVSVRKYTYATLPTFENSTAGDDIGYISITDGYKVEDTALTGWQTTINAGDWLMYNVNSATTVKSATLSVACRRR
jgi:hypothetical protein